MRRPDQQTTTRPAPETTLGNGTGPAGPDAAPGAGPAAQPGDPGTGPDTPPAGARSAGPGEPSARTEVMPWRAFISAKASRSRKFWSTNRLSN
ncbi:hypothetical protein ACWEK7_17935, partial [Streptomyces californicus]